MAIALIYSTNKAITFDLTDLAASATFVAGQESTEIDNTSDLFIDAIVSVKPITGHTSTVPAIGQKIGLWVWGSNIAASTTNIDDLEGLDGFRTLTHQSILNSLKSAGAPSVTVVTAALTYFIQPFSVANLFGGQLPKFWGLFLSHNHAAALGAAQTALFTYVGVTFSSS